ncbi:MAG: phospho-2-dehydro-3-deoxyheptonate aldolase [Nocardia sp.]|uniref:3-deoxy-7-phosphoheptulonate synthase n=1 Tax=Nocardia sp. TaxID=1821 RepID=UPI002616AF82|nr:3-deoxy-7-phosphoheptulonate synthase [Nocardia sp.]MCU1644920.1 phospho-2-dehydro-3-deoxyheptonate aldolase [Nocardia sp.]
MILIVLDGVRAQKDSVLIRAELEAEGISDIRALWIGSAEVLIVPHTDRSIADRVEAVSRSARVLVPVGGSPLAEMSVAGTGSIVTIAGTVSLGGPEFVVAAGPCAVESLAQLKASAAAVKESGGTILRGGAYKPRTSPYSFQGLHRPGVELLAQVGREFGLPVVSEIVDVRDLDEMIDKVDMFQVGARNAQNYTLLAELGRAEVPVLLKRGFGCTIDEWLGAAEYVLQEGNPDVVLCERGIRSFEHATRFTLDLAAVAVLKRRTHLPVIVDPSHSVGRRELVLPMALAAAAVGADGLIVDVHTDPTSAQCDAEQALLAGEFDELMKALGGVVSGVGRSFSVGEPIVAAHGLDEQPIPR